MAVRYTQISWADHTLNTWRGCQEITAGCAYCYAREITEIKEGDFHVPYYDDRPVAKQVKSLTKPVMGSDGLWYPSRVFVNSMSDAFWEKVPDERRDVLFDAMEKHPWVCWQILTKRDGEMLRYITARYSKKHPIPGNIWLGVSIEDGRYLHRLDALRTLKKQCGLQVAFASFEPLLGSIKGANLRARQTEPRERVFRGRLRADREGKRARPTRRKRLREGREAMASERRAPGNRSGERRSTASQHRVAGSPVATGGEATDSSDRGSTPTATTARRFRWRCCV